MSKSVLVFGARGRVGSEAQEIYKTAGFKVFGATSGKTLDNDTEVVNFKYGSDWLANEALKVNPTYVHLLIDSKSSKSIHDGKSIIDAVCLGLCDSVEHITFVSVMNANEAPEAVKHFKRLLEVEEHLKTACGAAQKAYSIVRPAAYMDMTDDPRIYNPLKKGKVSMLWGAELTVGMVSCRDVAKAMCATFQDSTKYNGKTIDAVGEYISGNGLAEACTKASGVPCKYSPALPRFVMRMFMSDLHHMVTFFEQHGYTGKVEDFKEVVPDAETAEDWFKRHGQWNNGEKFVPASGTTSA